MARKRKHKISKKQRMADLRNLHKEKHGRKKRELA